MHWHYNIKTVRIIYLCVNYFNYAVGKRCTIFKSCLFIISGALISSFYSCPNNSSSSTHKYECITAITYTWLQHWRFKFNVTIGVMFLVSYQLFQLIFCPKFRWFICFIVCKIYYFLIFHYFTIALVSDHH